jgi:GntP family gluconate:H+ symporter
VFVSDFRFQFKISDCKSETEMLNLLYLLLVIGLIIWAITRLKLHPFLTLLLAAILTGFLGGLDVATTLAQLTEGFGGTLRSIGIVIACGCIIGTFLERGGGAQTVASTVLNFVGQNRSPLAMSVTGFIVSIPVFCDSGFVLLSAINKSLCRRTGVSLAVLAVALATGLYTTHVFVPPTPGPLAAAGALGADLGQVLLLGLIVAIPTAAAGLFWALMYGKRFSILPGDDTTGGFPSVADQRPQVSGWSAFGPLVVPIALIAIKSMAEYCFPSSQAAGWLDVVRFVGHPVMALLIGVLLSLGLARRTPSETTLAWVSEGLKGAGAIILITGAGGAFGNVLRATGIGNTLAEGLAGWKIGIVLPFAVATILKSAQGSSTVAIITTAELISPLLDTLELTAPAAKALVVLAIGAGSMTVSHLNDSYFWVVSQFSDMDTPTALRCFTSATLIQGLVGIATIAVLAQFIL